jgi:hypothetical protein
VIRLAAANLAEAHYSANAIMVPSPGIKPVSKRERIDAMLQGKSFHFHRMAFGTVKAMSRRSRSGHDSKK